MDGSVMEGNLLLKGFYLNKHISKLEIEKIQCYINKHCNVFFNMQHFLLNIWPRTLSNCDNLCNTIFLKHNWFSISRLNDICLPVYIRYRMLSAYFRYNTNKRICKVIVIFVIALIYTFKVSVDIVVMKVKIICLYLPLDRKKP